MNRADFDHVIAAAANLTGEDEFVVIGSQAGNLGDGSMFHAQFGFFAHGVGPETVKAPAGWQERSVRVPIPARLLSKREPVAWCLEIHDLVLAKVAARRERDWEFAREALKAGLVSGDELLKRATDLPLHPQTLDYVLGILRAIVEAEAGGRR